MGWDAHAILNKNAPDYKEAKKAFKAASNAIRLVYTNGVDGDLKRGGLDCFICGDILELATKLSVYKDWSQKEVQKAWKQANWEFAKESAFLKKELWAYYSAKFFLKICYRYNLEIEFSY